MSMARLVIMSVVVEGRSKSEVARDYGVSRRWVQKLVARYVAEGEAAFEPRSRRPRTSPQAVGTEIKDEIVELRKHLSGDSPLFRSQRGGLSWRAHMPSLPTGSGDL